MQEKIDIVSIQNIDLDTEEILLSFRFTNKVGVVKFFEGHFRSIQESARFITDVIDGLVWPNDDGLVLRWEKKRATG